MKLQTTVKHAAADGSDFVTGLRDYFQYRETGIKDATGGMFTAHVIRAVPGKTFEPTWHSHKASFQMFFVLAGWVEFEYEDIGRVRMEAGSSVYQPPGVMHREIQHSDDFVVLEVVSPGDFATELANVD